MIVGLFRRGILVRCLLVVAGWVCLAGQGRGAVLVQQGAVWRYLDDGSNQGTAWRERAFDDGSWEQGPAQLGYGDGDEATVVSFGGNASGKHITTYFRHTFMLADPAGLPPLDLRVKRDDGVVVYLNGSEVFRDNMPAGVIHFDTTASATATGEDTFLDLAISAGLLVAGDNVVAAEIHQRSGDSSDISFDFSMTTSAGNPMASLVRGPYLQLVTTTSAVVRWRTDVAVASVVRYGTNPASLDRTNAGGVLRTEHETGLSGLMPDTKYFYSVGTSTGILAEGGGYYLVTSPAGGQRPLRVWVLGDSGRANAGARAVRDAYAGWNGTRHTDAILMLGDNAYENGTEAEMQAAVFGNYGAMMSHSPLWPVLGNHDTAGSSAPPASLPYFVNLTLPAAGQAGGIASGTEKYYSYNLGNVHFVALDSMSSGRAANGTMANWLRSDLAGHGRTFVVAYYHHPPHSRGSAPSDSETRSVEMRSNINPILEQFGTDLVLAGHSHCYERSFLINGHYGASATFNSSMVKNGGDGRLDGDGAYFKPGLGADEGTVYVVAGASQQADSGALNHPAMYFSQSVLGSLVLDVSGTRMDVTYLDSTRGVRDYFSIEKLSPDHIVITSQPRSAAVEPGVAVSLSVGAFSSEPIVYQWRKDGQPLAGATTAVYHLPGVSEPDLGGYDVVLSDSRGTTNSQVAFISLRVRPVVTRPPVATTVVEGGTVTFSLETEGSLPMSYRWRLDGMTLTNFVEMPSNVGFITLTNVQLAQAGKISVALSNEVSHMPGVLSQQVQLTVLADLDRDGLPDAFESDRGLNPDDPADALLDLDGDGMSQVEEYRSQTDPDDGGSFLRVDGIVLNGGVEIEFRVRSNRTYTVQFKEGFGTPVWQRLRDVVAEPADRVGTIRDLLGTENRYYRVVTPRVSLPWERVGFP